VKKAALVLGTVYVIFISLFALDSLGSVPELLIHLIPSFVLVFLIIVGMKKSMIGGISFVVLSAVFTLFFNTYESPATLLTISLPPAIVGILFTLSER
jgi:hypothetical protein